MELYSQYNIPADIKKGCPQYAKKTVKNYIWI